MSDFKVGVRRAQLCPKARIRKEATAVAWPPACRAGAHVGRGGLYALGVTVA